MLEGESLYSLQEVLMQPQVDMFTDGRGFWSHVAKLDTVFLNPGVDCLFVVRVMIRHTHLAVNTPVNQVKKGVGAWEDYTR